MGLLSLLKPEHRFFQLRPLQFTPKYRFEPKCSNKFQAKCQLSHPSCFSSSRAVKSVFLGDDYLTRSLELKNVNLYRASDISRSHGPAKFRYFREIPQNSPKNAKYFEICQKYFQIHVGKTYLILILAIRPVLFTLNVQIYLETSSLQQVNNVPKLPGVLRLMLRKTGR